MLVPERTLTLPRILHNFGYVSANIGKLHFLPHANRDHRAVHPDYGFDHLEISEEPGCYEDAYRAWVSRRAPDQLALVSAGLSPAAHDWYRVMHIQDTVPHPVDGPRNDVGGPIPFPAKGYPGHDCVTRVPLIVRWPGQVESQGRTNHTIVEAVDVVPTLLEGAGIPIPFEVQGRSRLGLLRAADPGQHGTADGEGSALTEMAGWKTLRTARYRYLVEEGGREALYDLARDPAGYCDVAAEDRSAPVLAAMRRLLLQRLIERERPLPCVWAY